MTALARATALAASPVYLVAAAAAAAPAWHVLVVYEEAPEAVSHSAVVEELIADATGAAPVGDPAALV